MNFSLRITSLAVLLGFVSLISAAAQTLTFSPSSLNFKDHAINTTSQAQSVTVENTGTTTLTITNISASAEFGIYANTCQVTLDAGKKCKVSVTFSPTQLGTITGAVTFTDSANGSPQTVALSGTGVAQEALSPLSLSFSSPFGITSKPQYVFLTNNLSSALTGLTYSLTAPFNIFTTNCTSTLDAHKTCNWRVDFTPQQTGTIIGTLTVSYNASSSPQTVSLSGTTIENADVTPSSLSFPLTEVGQTSSTMNATVHSGVGYLEDIAYSTTGPFEVASSTCPSTLADHRECIIRVTFAPTQSGNATGMLTVTDSAGTQTVSLSGTGTSAGVYPAPASVDFGSQPVGTTSKPVEIDLFNETSEQVTMSSISASAGFSVTDNHCLDGLKPNSHCNLQVVFSPTQSGTYSGTLTFVDSATSSPQIVSLSGTGD